MAGKLYLIPTTLGNSSLADTLPNSVFNAVNVIDDYIVENEKLARRFIKAICPKKIQSQLKIQVLNKHTDGTAIQDFLKACSNHKPMGLLSEAGCPGIADPGAEIVKLAHQKQIQVVPLVGPSSIILALMSSGLNGQNFAFNGYLPINNKDCKIKLKKLERIAFENKQSQLFIETPFRNNKLMETICNTLHPDTQLCIACDITLPTEYIKTMPIDAWKKTKMDLHKRPTMFIIQRF